MTAHNSGIIEIRNIDYAPMIQLHQELNTLSRCVKYQNLSQAAAHVGLSQPQLSRVISKIESELGVVLLDRTARRKSAWTPLAFKISQIYSQGVDKLSADLSSALDSSSVTHLTIGTLEGMIPEAAELIHKLFKSNQLQSADLLVHDLSELEVAFSKGLLDLIFSVRPPGKRKYEYEQLIGYQSLDSVKKSDAFKVYSSFEYSTLAPKQKKKSSNPVFVSNSLMARKHWLETFGGTGVLPSPVADKKSGKKDSESVLVIGSDGLSQKLWSTIVSSF